MIEKNVVFVLGAGASKVFGFPSGSELKDSVVKNIGFVDTRRKIIEKFGFSDEFIIKFCSSLHQSGRNSVDAFLENRSEFVEIGKIAIAHELVPFERQDNLFNSPNNWCQYIFNKMDGEFNDFGKNKIQFITFNYDRSLETFFFNALKNSFGKTDNEVAEELKKIQIIHVHGQMGYLHWQNNDVKKIREYSPKNIDDRKLKIAANGIKIIHEANENDPEFQKAREILTKSDTIIFLGFGYNKKNVQRLKIDFKRKNIWGSSYGMSVTEMKVINSKLLMGRLHFSPPPEDCLSFLRNQIDFI